MVENSFGYNVFIYFYRSFTEVINGVGATDPLMSYLNTFDSWFSV